MDSDKLLINSVTKKIESKNIEKFLSAHTSIVFIVNMKREVVCANNTFLKVFGFKKEEIVGKRALDLLKNKNSILVENFNKKVLDQGKEIDGIEVKLEFKNGKIFYVIMSKKPIFDEFGKIYGLCCFFIDITKAKILEKKLKKQLKKYEDFRITVENANNIIIIINKNKVIDFVNKEFVNVTGYLTEEIVGKKLIDLKKYGLFEKKLKEILEKIKAKKVWNGIFFGKSKSGKHYYINTTVTPIFCKDKKLEKIVAISKDVTREIENERIIKKQEKILQENIKLASLSRMVKNIAHHWRQPLSTITAASGTLFAKEKFGIEISKNEKMKNFELIEKTCEKLSKSIEFFDNLYESNQKKEKLFFSNFFKEGNQNIFKELYNFNVKFIYNVEECETKIYKNYLLQVIEALNDNILDAFKRNNIQNKIVILNVKKIEDKIYIELKDNAGGIDKEIFEKIFEPYVSIKYNSYGVGMGLYSAKSIVQNLLNGELNISNIDFEYNGKKYKGVKVTIIL